MKHLLIRNMDDQTGKMFDKLLKETNQSAASKAAIIAAEFYLHEKKKMEKKIRDLEHRIEEYENLIVRIDHQKRQKDEIDQLFDKLSKQAIKAEKNRFVNRHRDF